jgi:hypothetical protein
MTPEQLQTFLRMNEEGYSTSAIADVIGKTRNAIIGYARRQGIALKHSRGPTGPRKKKEHKPVVARLRPRTFFKILSDVPVKKVEPIKVKIKNSVFKTCQFIKNDDTKNPIYCGEPNVPGRPYCVAHCRLCYKKPGEDR